MMDLNGKVYTGDERWVTIGGKDEDGGGQHVLIKENGTIVAGFGTGKNVRSAFGEKKADTPEKANAAVKSKQEGTPRGGDYGTDIDSYVKQAKERFEKGQISHEQYLKEYSEAMEKRRQDIEKKKSEIERTAAEKKSQREKAMSDLMDKYDAVNKKFEEAKTSRERIDAMKERSEIGRQFKSEYGMSPFEYWKKYRQDAEGSTGKKADAPAKANAAVKSKTSQIKSDDEVRREQHDFIDKNHEAEKSVIEKAYRDGIITKGVYEKRMGALNEQTKQRKAEVDGETGGSRAEAIRRVGELYREQDKPDFEKNPNAEKMLNERADLIAKYGITYSEIEKGYKMAGGEGSAPAKKGNGVNISKATSNMVGGKFRNDAKEWEAENKARRERDKEYDRQRGEVAKNAERVSGLYNLAKETETRGVKKAVWLGGKADVNEVKATVQKYNDAAKRIKNRADKLNEENSKKAGEIAKNYQKDLHSRNKKDFATIEKNIALRQSLANAREKLKPIREKANTERLAKGDIIATSPDGKTYRYKLGTSGGDSIRSKDLNREYHHIGGMKGFIDKLKKDGYTVKRDYEGLGSSGVKVTSPDGRTYNYQPSAKGSDYIRQSDFGRSYYYKGGLPALLQKLDKEGYDIAAHTRKISKPSKDVHVGKAKTNASEEAETANRFIKQTDRNQKRHTQFNNEQNKLFEKMLLGYKGSKYQKMAERVDGLGNGKYASLANRLRQEGSRAKRKWDADVNALREVLGKENDRFNTKYEADRDRYNKENERRKRKYEAAGNALNRYRSKFRKAQDANIFVAQKRNEE